MIIPTAGLGAIVATVESAVVADPDLAVVFWINPDGVVIGVGTGHAVPGLAAVNRHPARVAAGKNLLVVGGVYANLAEVHGAVVAAAHLGPGLSAIVGAIYAIAVGIGGRRSSAATTSSTATTATTTSAAGPGGIGARGAAVTTTTAATTTAAEATTAGRGKQLRVCHRAGRDRTG